MQNFDVQLNLLLVKKAVLVVLSMCLALYLQRGSMEKPESGEMNDSTCGSMIDINCNTPPSFFLRSL